MSSTEGLNIGNDGAEAIAQGLPLLEQLFSCTNLLMLVSSNIGTEGAIAISRKLPLLQGLGLGTNNIGN
jgi:hypothetical protein